MAQPLPPNPDAEVTPLLVIGAGRAALAFVSRLPAERLRGVLGACCADARAAECLRARRPVAGAWAVSNARPARSC
jgi:hypothetical protein